jgi:hypothetical protein
MIWFHLRLLTAARNPLRFGESFGHDLELERVRRRVNDQGVAALELERTGNLPDAQHHRSDRSPDLELPLLECGTGPVSYSAVCTQA